MHRKMKVNINYYTWLIDKYHVCDARAGAAAEWRGVWCSSVCWGSRTDS